MMAGSAWLYTLAGIGALTVSIAVYNLVDFVAFHLIKPSAPLERYKREAGPNPTYALITGASAGIGLGVAQALVRRGFGVILLGHLADELAQAKARLEELQPGAAVRVLVMDALTASPPEMEAAVRSLEALQVSVLVNNVGSNPVALPAFRGLATYSAADVDAVIDMNARFMARLTALMLPLLSRKAPGGGRQRSLIVNMSSMGMVGSPWLVMYGATKGFNLAFSRGLARELETSPETSHIDCLAVVPGDVLSQGNCKGVPKSAPRWDEYGRCVVDKVDGAVRRKRRDVSPYWLHDVQIRILAWLDEGTVTAEADKMLRRKKDAWDAYHEKTQ